MQACRRRSTRTQAPNPPPLLHRRGSPHHRLVRYSPMAPFSSSDCLQSEPRQPTPTHMPCGSQRVVMMDAQHGWSHELRLHAVWAKAANAVTQKSLNPEPCGSGSCYTSPRLRRRASWVSKAARHFFLSLSLSPKLRQASMMSITIWARVMMLTCRSATDQTSQPLERFYTHTHPI